MISAKAHHFTLEEHVLPDHRQTLSVVDKRHGSFHQRVWLDHFFFRKSSPTGDEALAFERSFDFFSGQASWSDIFIRLEKKLPIEFSY